MNREPRAVSLVAEGLSHIADGAGLVLLVALGWRMFFVFDAGLQERALVVALLGLLATAANPRSVKTMPIALAAYVGVALVSAAAHRWGAVSSSPTPIWLSLFTPAHHLVVMAAFVYGAAHLLRTPGRLTWFVILMVTAIAVLAVQIAFDRAASGFVYVRGGPSLQSVPQWGGIHGTSLLLTIALPLVCAALLSRWSVWRAIAVTMLAGTLLAVGYLNGSRGGLVSMVLVLAAMAVFAMVKRTRGHRQAALLGVGVLVVAGGLAAGVWSMRGSLERGEDLSGRTLMWQAAGQLVLQHPWLGVGPGNYEQAMVAGGQAEKFADRLVGLPNAHNLLLHVAAETGLAGALCLALLMAWAVRACWRTWRAGYLPMVSLGVLFAVGGFLAHSLTENFLDARVEVERTRLIVWLLLAAVLALERLPRGIAASRSSSILT